jgi:hypothetical protein
MRMAVAEVIVETLESLDLEFPVLSDEKRNELDQARKLLEEEKG